MYKNIQSKSVNLTYSIQSLVITNNANKGVVLRGLNKKDFLNDQLINKKIIDGNIEKFGNSYISIGSNLAEQLGVQIDARTPHHEMLAELQEILILTKMYG